jgi:hypothetical protein
MPRVLVKVSIASLVALHAETVESVSAASNPRNRRKIKIRVCRAIIAMLGVGFGLFGTCSDNPLIQ